jgi:hypothetical protein
MFRTALIKLVVTLATATLVLAGSPTAGARAPSNDAITAARFSISVDGHSLGSWSKVQGLTVTFDSPRTVELGRYSSTSTSLALVAWHEAGLAGRLVAARDVVIVVYGANGHAVARYHLENAWPSKVEIGRKSSGSDVLYESVTFTCEDIQRVSP